jgi:hypothetical protein
MIFKTYYNRHRENRGILGFPSGLAEKEEEYL